jgi:hypothetical protein
VRVPHSVSGTKKLEPGERTRVPLKPAFSPLLRY